MSMAVNVGVGIGLGAGGVWRNLGTGDKCKVKRYVLNMKQEMGMCMGVDVGWALVSAWT